MDTEAFDDLRLLERDAQIERDNANREYND